MAAKVATDLAAFRDKRRADSFADYQQIKAVNWSTLKELAKSPLHYQHRLANPREDTGRMAFGRAVHSAVLEPDRFPLDFVVFDGARRAGTEWAEFAAVNQAKTILKRDEYDTCLNVRDAVHSHKVARRLLRWGRPEVTLQWTDPDTRIRCKARLDWLFGDFLTDLKTTGDVDNGTFGRLSARMGYHTQLAFYRMGLLATGHELTPVHIIAVEAEAPHDVGVFTLDRDTLDAGELEVCRLLALLKDCRRRRQWPGRYQTEETLDFPTWAKPNENDLTDLGINFEVRPGVTT
jgi:hypothetical protein